MPMLISSIKNHLSQWQTQGLWRKRRAIAERVDSHIVIDQQRLNNFASNDYLNLTTHPAIKSAFIEGVKKYGVGSGSSSHISGYFAPQEELEMRFATLLQRERAILFNSGYHANLGVLATLANRHSTVLADKLCHASILQGIQLSQAKHLRYKHNDLTHARFLLNKTAEPVLMISEGVFSMEGDIAEADQLAQLAREQHAFLILDDAHGFGVLGPNGLGICDYFKLSNADVPCLIIPFGKALGSQGAVVAGDADLIEALIQFASTQRYTTALPPASIAATLKSLEIIATEPERRTQLQRNVQHFINKATQLHLPLVNDAPTPIKALMVGDNQRVQMIQDDLFKKGFFISAIRPPTVPRNTARLRISLNYAHHLDEIDQLLDHIAAAYAKYQ